MKRKIIVACGGAVATSTMAAEEIKELCQSHNIPVELIQCRVNEIETYMTERKLSLEPLIAHRGSFESFAQAVRDIARNAMPGKVLLIP